MPRINWTMRNSSYDLTISHRITIAIWEVGWNLNSSWSTTSWHNIHTVDKQILMLIRAGAANWLLLHTNLVGIYNFDYSETGPTTSWSFINMPGMLARTFRPCYRSEHACGASAWLTFPMFIIWSWWVIWIRCWHMILRMLAVPIRGGRAHNMRIATFSSSC